MRKTSSWKAAVAVGAFVVVAPFVAATPAAASPAGAVVFYANTSSTNPIRTIRYLDCDTAKVFPLGQVTGSYDNRPADGCRVQVSVGGSTWYTLCSGKHVMPAAYRTAPKVR